MVTKAVEGRVWWHEELCVRCKRKKKGVWLLVFSFLFWFRGVWLSALGYLILELGYPNVGSE